MKIGLISDTHDNLPKIEKAVGVFNRKKVSLVLHAGDYVAPFSVLPFKKLNCDYLGVFGNNDGEREGLISISEGRIREGPIDLERDSKRIIVVHDLNKLDLKNKIYDFVIYGHIHKPEIMRKSTHLFINPGECSGWLTKRSTIAILDLSNLSVEILKL